ncbi:PadR family transcriptional regulator [Actinomyces bowdenii]|uniref:PadR family transcriptional regulator n=1 Tax=Actinomyces bowdenii TaxID=131109 RepID=A0A3P1V9N3_9ACTO|nr:PadR family transcriptional regulator [Actinomyces bowdenii]MBO3725715.1 PadR family transcriptional regulator [Actinomyces bowdenii]RRD30377.1 PadR family transcriptional regulator [Actinomyces bowdenii]
MKLRHAILGLLADEPRSGYDISRAFAGSVVHFWYADQSQVYRTISRLEADGAISTRVIPQSGRPDRRVHSLTDAGRAELDAWLTSPLEPRQNKDTLLARVFFAASLGHEGVLALLDEVEQMIRADQEELEAVEQTLLTEIDGAGERLDTVLKMATLRYGLDGAREELRWIERTRQAVRDDAARAVAT